MVFRQDINGLRSLSVIAVILYHLDSTLLPGGFSGVDVFFVISGYLMTGIIVTGVLSGDFSYLGFMKSRVKRIVPPLLFLCVSLLIFGYLFLTSIDYYLLADHALSSLFFFSNIIYWLESGYFDALSSEKWLLHTWSLSVEWQFYMLYPIFIVVCCKFFKISKLPYLLLFLCGLSFVLCIVATSVWATPSFYMLPTRAWEMLAGGLAYFIVLPKSSCRFWLHYAGLAIILLSTLYLNSSFLWPGYLAFLPVAGAFLVIISTYQNSFLSNSSFFRLIGSASYSLYLWHWPIFVFFELYYNNLPLFIPFVISVFLGLSSYFLIERNPSFLFFKKITSICFLWALGMCFALVVSIYNGFSVRSDLVISEAINTIESSPHRAACHTKGANYLKPNSACVYGNSTPSWAVLGDSHAVELAYELSNSLDVNKAGVKHLSFSACVPTLVKGNDNTPCSEWTNDSIDEIIKDEKIKNVVIAYRYSAALYGDNVKDYPNLVDYKSDQERMVIFDSLSDIIARLSAAKQHVYIVLPVPEMGQSVKRIIGYDYFHSGDINTEVAGVSLDYYLKRNSSILGYFNKLTFENVHLINVENIFCGDELCYAVKGGVSLYFDDDHPSLSGAALITDSIVNAHHRLIETIN